MIQLRSVNRIYPLKGGPFYALRNIDLTINEGDFISIMGPSGSGKSTLLHILGLHDASWDGEYWFGDQPVHKLDKKKRFDLQKRTIGFVSFLNQYGPALVTRLQQQLPLGPGHWVVAI